MSNNWYELMQSIHKRDELSQKLTGLSSLLEIAASVNKVNGVSSNVTALNSVSVLARYITLQKNVTTASSILHSSIINKYDSIDKSKSNFALSGLTSSLVKLAAKNQMASDRLANVAISQMTATSYIQQLVKSVNNTHLNKFNAINVAFQGISNNYLQQTAKANAWQEVDIAELANDTISNLTNITLNQNSTITKDDLEELRTSLILELSTILSKTKSKTALNYIINLMNILGFIISIYCFSKAYNDISNAKVLAETKQALEELKSDFSHQINDRLQQLNKTRIARTNVNLRFSAQKRSNKIGLVKEGQEVNIIEIRHKFLLISYIDYETNEPKSGFVVKKYFISAQINVDNRR